MPSIIAKAKSLFRRSSRSRETSSHGPAATPICNSSEDSGMAVALSPAEDVLEDDVEVEKTLIEEKEEILIKVNII